MVPSRDTSSCDLCACGLASLEFPINLTADSPFDSAFTFPSSDVNNLPQLVNMWPFSSSYPEVSPSKVDGKTCDYIIVGGAIFGWNLAPQYFKLMLGV